MEKRNLVEHRCQPLRLLFPVQVQSPDRVAQRLGAHRHLRGEGLFREMHQRTADLQVFREIVLPVHTQHRLALHTVVGIRLEGGGDVRLRIQDALVDDGHLTGGVIDGIVGAFRQFHATSPDRHGTFRHVIGAQGDDIGRRAFELSSQDKLILFCILLCHRLSGVVELGEGILLSIGLRESVLDELLPQITAEGF